MPSRTTSAASFLSLRIDSLEFAVYIVAQEGLPLLFKPHTSSILIYIHDNALGTTRKSIHLLWFFLLL